MGKLDLSSPEALASLRYSYRPVGSGPLGLMRVIVTLVEALAEAKGWDIDSVEFVASWDGKVYSGNPPRRKEP